MTTQQFIDQHHKLVFLPIYYEMRTFHINAGHFFPVHLSYLPGRHPYKKTTEVACHIGLCQSCHCKIMHLKHGSIQSPLIWYIQALVHYSSFKTSMLVDLKNCIHASILSKILTQRGNLSKMWITRQLQHISSVTSPGNTVADKKENPAGGFAVIINVTKGRFLQTQQTEMNKNHWLLRKTNTWRKAMLRLEKQSPAVFSIHGL